VEHSSPPLPALLHASPPQRPRVERKYQRLRRKMNHEFFALDRVCSGTSAKTRSRSARPGLASPANDGRAGCSGCTPAEPYPPGRNNLLSTQPVRRQFKRSQPIRNGTENCQVVKRIGCGGQSSRTLWDALMDDSRAWTRTGRGELKIREQVQRRHWITREYQHTNRDNNITRRLRTSWSLWVGFSSGLCNGRSNVRQFTRAT
jgi:hypothetical protein